MWNPEWPGRKRRRFLVGALLSLAGSLQAARLIGSESVGVAGILRGMFSETSGAVAVGRRYLRSHPEEASATWLSQALFGSESALDMNPGGIEFLRERIRAGRVQDFVDGDLVILDGWTVARTEARLLALASLCLAG